LAKQILIVDDHVVVREGLKTLFGVRSDWVVCGEAANGREAVEKTCELEPDVVILDVSMPEMNGIEAARRILQLRPNQKIVIHTMHDSNAFICEAEKIGVRGILRKSNGSQDVIQAVTEVLNGSRFFPSTPKQKTTSAPSEQPRGASPC
jgi:DNA-binding NarL/FixJ family response regulator